jgi:heme exporter protein CcmD
MELFAMGEYGSFVWSSYLLTLVVVVVSTIQAKRRHGQITDGIRRKLKAQENSE